MSRDPHSVADQDDGHADDQEALRSPAHRMPPRKPAPPAKRKSGPSGLNLSRDVKLRAEDDEVERWELAAQRSGATRNDFLRLAANQLADEVLGEDD